MFAFVGIGFGAITGLAGLSPGGALFSWERGSVALARIMACLGGLLGVWAAVIYMCAMAEQEGRGKALVSRTLGYGCIAAAILRVLIEWLLASMYPSAVGPLDPWFVCTAAILTAGAFAVCGALGIGLNEFFTPSRYVHDDRFGPFGGAADLERLGERISAGALACGFFLALAGWVVLI